MSQDQYAKFNFKRFLSLGREVSETHKEFKMLAPLDNTESETEAFFLWLDWAAAHPNADMITQLRQLNRFFGMAHYVTTKVKEVGRLCLMLGDTTPRDKFKRGKPNE